MIQNTDILYAQKLRHLRLSKNIKQEAIFKQIGFESQQAYSNLENGKTHFTDDILNKIAKVFGIDVSEFTKPVDHVMLNHSPNAYIQSNHNNNDFIEKMVHSYESCIKAKDELIEMLKKEIEMLKKA
jgi:transcriptional regulator with XRE-family HTH domain